jgi:hypothetical protein
LAAILFLVYNRSGKTFVEGMLTGDPSFKLDRPIGRTLLLAILILLLAMAAAEGLARISLVRQRLPVSSFGNYHYQFEIKWFHLQRYVDQHGGVDVLLMGSSLVNSGIEPEQVNQAWMQASGQPALRIFNFGVEGLTVEPNSVLAELLVESFHPAVIIFGTEIRDYAANNGTETAQNFLNDPWVQYRQGQFSLQGWLAEHSAAYRYFLAYRNWMRADFAENHTQIIRRTGNLTSDGYDIENRVAEDPYRPPDPQDPEDAKAFEVFAGFEFADSRLADLESMLALESESGIEVLLIEMPVTPQFFDFFEAREAAHQEFLQIVSDRADAAGSPFLPAIPEDELPPDARSDRVHLSKYGAAAFSQYLGEWLARLFLETGLDLRQEGNAP